MASATAATLLGGAALGCALSAGCRGLLTPRPEGRSAAASGPSTAATGGFDQQVTFIHCESLERSLRFYRDVLQLDQVLEQVPPGGSEAVVVILRTSPSSFIGLCRSGTGVAADGKGQDGVILCFVTDKVDEWGAKLSAIPGVTIEKPPTFNERYNIYHLFVRDPDGYLVEIQTFRDPAWPRAAAVPSPVFQLHDVGKVSVTKEERAASRVLLSRPAGTTVMPEPQPGGWEARLHDSIYRVCRLGGTEPRGVTQAFGGFDDSFEPGTYLCACCDAGELDCRQSSSPLSLAILPPSRPSFSLSPRSHSTTRSVVELYDSECKFDCGCGWPGFWNCRANSVLAVPDVDGVRTEIRCVRCDSHLGHVQLGEVSESSAHRFVGALTLDCRASPIRLQMSVTALTVAASPSDGAPTMALCLAPTAALCLLMLAGGPAEVVALSLSLVGVVRYKLLRQASKLDLERFGSQLTPKLRSWILIRLLGGRLSAMKERSA